MLSNRPLDNANPEIKKLTKITTRTQESLQNENDDELYDPIDPLEIYDLIREIRDPEHPLSLEALGVVNLENIKVTDSIDEDGRKNDTISVIITPTIPHCSLATLIGLSIHTQLKRTLPERFKVKVTIEEGTHEQEDQLNRQLNDKERVFAALENKNLLKVINQCLSYVNVKN